MYFSHDFTDLRVKNHYFEPNLSNYKSIKRSLIPNPQVRKTSFALLEAIQDN
jgi:hypothetical protein